jgi:hypothetical protein
MTGVKQEKTKQNKTKQSKKQQKTGKVSLARTF